MLLIKEIQEYSHKMIEQLNDKFTGLSLDRLLKIYAFSDGNKNSALMRGFLSKTNTIDNFSLPNDLSDIEYFMAYYVRSMNKMISKNGETENKRLFI